MRCGGALLNEVRQRGAQEPNYSVIECDGNSERWLSSTRSTPRLRQDEWAVVLSRFR